MRNALLAANAVEGAGDVVAQDAVAAVLPNALAGEVPALGRSHRGERAKEGVPRANDHLLRQLAHGAQRQVGGGAAEVRPCAFVHRGKSLKANRAMRGAGSVVTVYQCQVPSLTKRGPRGLAERDLDGLAVFELIAQREGHAVARAREACRGAGNAPVLVKHGERLDLVGKQLVERAQQGVLARDLAGKVLWEVVERDGGGTLGTRGCHRLWLGCYGGHWGLGALLQRKLALHVLVGVIGDRERDGLRLGSCGCGWRGLRLCWCGLGFCRRGRGFCRGRRPDLGLFCCSGQYLGRRLLDLALRLWRLRLNGLCLFLRSCLALLGSLFLGRTSLCQNLREGLCLGVSCGRGLGIL